MDLVDQPIANISSDASGRIVTESAESAHAVSVETAGVSGCAQALRTTDAATSTSTLCVDASTEEGAIGWLATRKLSRGSDESLRDDLLSVRADEALVPFVNCGGRGWSDVELVVEIKRLAAVGGCPAAAGSARRSLASASGGSATKTVGAGVETACPTARGCAEGAAAASVAPAKTPAAGVATAAKPPPPVLPPPPPWAKAAPLSEMAARNKAVRLSSREILMRASLLWAGPSSVRKRTGLNLEDLDRGGLRRTALFKPSNVFKVAARGGISVSSRQA